MKFLDIDVAEWEWVVEDRCWTLKVHDKDGREVVCYLTKRPPYCDRGHWMFQIDGHLNIDFADSFPRYFFTLKEADWHVRTFLKWRLWNVRCREEGL